MLLVELARLLASGAEASRLREIGIAAIALLGVGTVLGAALTLWLHVVDARFASDLRSRLLSKLSRLPLGWFTARGSGSIKALVQDDTLSLHYLVTHAIPDAVAAVVAPVAVLVYLFVVDWRVALVLFVPVLFYLVLTSSITIQSGPRIPQSQRWAEKMSGEAGAYLEGQPVIRVFGGAAASSFRRRLDEYVGFLGRLAASAGRQENLDGSGHSSHDFPMAHRRHRHPAGGHAAGWTRPTCCRSCCWAPHSARDCSISPTGSAASAPG